MRSRLFSVALAGITAVSATAVWAQDTTTNPDDTAAVSEANVTTNNGGYLKGEAVGLKPQVGVLNFKDANGDATNRGGIGLAFDMNFSRLFSGAPQNVYIGLSTGGLYSHLGNPGSGFFGSSSSGAIAMGNSGANLVMIPANAKLGYNFSDHFRISAHGGGNVLYASVPSAIGPELAGDASRNWNIFPNVGGDVDFGLSRSVALTLRPDWTFTPGVGFFTGTLELGIALG